MYFQFVEDTFTRNVLLRTFICKLNSFIQCTEITVIKIYNCAAYNVYNETMQMCVYGLTVCRYIAQF